MVKDDSSSGLSPVVIIFTFLFLLTALITGYVYYARQQLKAAGKLDAPKKVTSKKKLEREKKRNRFSLEG
jgi:preprotein translocase subunit SecG